jgi:hypothetical protein
MAQHTAATGWHSITGPSGSRDRQATAGSHADVDSAWSSPWFGQTYRPHGSGTMPMGRSTSLTPQ